MRPRFQWQIGSRSLSLGERTLIMGVVNVTPDSFSDGGLYLDPQRAVKHALRLLDEGADILDIGGESTRAGTATAKSTTETPRRREEQTRSNSDAVSADEELARILPVISEIKGKRPDAVISIDSYKAAVAEAAVSDGAEIVNDISGFRWDPRMLPTLAHLHCGAVLMHTRGRPDEWRTLPPLENPVELVKRELGEWSHAAMKAGINRERIVLDPGFGFGKRFEENYPLLSRFDELHALGFPLLAGASRKSFIGRAMSRGNIAPGPQSRLTGSLAAMAMAIMRGAHIVRVHDVRESAEAAAVLDAVMK